MSLGEGLLRLTRPVQSGIKPLNSIAMFIAYYALRSAQEDGR
jgi:hypothetical protein